MHAEKCPVCKGRGIVLIDTGTTSEGADKTCPGCRGTCWVTVQDYPLPRPYKDIPMHHVWE